MLRIRVIQTLQIPATIRRELPDPLPTRGHQIPVLLRRLHPTRQPQPHTHDHNRILGGHHRHTGLHHRNSRTSHQLQHEPSQPLRVRIVERQRRRQHTPSRSLEPVPQLDRRQRIEPQLLERPPRLHRTGRSMPQNSRNLPPHHIQHHTPPLLRRQTHQPRSESGLRLPHTRNQLNSLRQAVEERTSPARAEQWQKLRPPHIRDRERLLPGSDGQCERLQRTGRCHGVETPSAQLCRGLVTGGHTDLGPWPPRHSRTRQPLRPTPNDQSIQRRIRSPIRSLPRTPPHTGDRREHHERIDITHQRVQMQRPIDLAPHHPLQMRHISLSQRHILTHTSRMHHRIDRPHSRQQRLDRDPISQITRMDLRTRQLSQQLRRPGRLRTTPRHQHQPLSTTLRHPTRHLRPEPTGPTRDQHRAPRTPHLTLRSRRTMEPPHGNTAHAHRDLVLRVESPAEYRGDPTARAGVDLLRKVQQTAPELRVFQRDGPPESPELRLSDIHRAIGPAGGHRTPGNQPQRGLAPRIHHRLDQGQRLGQRAGSRYDSGGTETAQYGRQLRPRTRRYGEHRGAVLLQRGSEWHVADQRPGAREPHRSGLRERFPGDPVTPAGQRRPLPALGTPTGQRRQDAFQRAFLDTELCGQAGQVALLDPVPEPRLDRVRRRRPELEPVVLVLEGVRRQLGRLDAGEQRRPVHRHAVDVEGGQRREHGGDLVAVTAQQRNSNRLRLLHQRTQHRVRAQFHEPGHAVERADRVGEPDRPPNLLHPVLRIRPLPRLHHPPRHRRHRRHRRLAEGQPAHHRTELRQHRLHQPRMERMTGPQTRRLPTTPGNPVDVSLTPGHHHRTRPVHHRNVNVGELRHHLRLGSHDREHRPTRRQRLHQTTPSRHQRDRILQRQHPRHISRRNLTNRMPHQDIGPHTPRRKQGMQGHLDREQRGLRVPGPVDQFLVAPHG